MNNESLKSKKKFVFMLFVFKKRFADEKATFRLLQGKSRQKKKLTIIITYILHN